MRPLGVRDDFIQGHSFICPVYANQLFLPRFSVVSLRFLDFGQEVQTSGPEYMFPVITPLDVGSQDLYTEWEGKAVFVNLTYPRGRRS